MIEDINHFLDSFIQVIVFSIPIFFLALSLWSQGFSVVIDNQVQKFYLTKESSASFLAQTVLMVASLIFSLWSRFSRKRKNKENLLYISLICYVFSIFAFGYLINSLRIIFI